MPMAAVSFIDAEREWFKSRLGFATSEIAREAALGDRAIGQDAPVVVPDLRADDRLAAYSASAGEPLIRFYAAAPLKTPEGHDIGALAVMDRRPRELGPDDTALLVDLARIVMDELELRRLAVNDQLSGAMSRRAFQAEAKRDFALARRHKQELSCIVLDIDQLGRTNEIFGRLASDAAIGATIELCRHGLRSSDYIGRLDGDEFAIMLPQTGVRAALHAAERLRKSLERQQFPTPAGPLKITASFGIASCDASVADVGALLRRGDVALYGAKSAGGNRCVNFATQHLRTIDRVA
jgi:diguanylate cyclase (GGDEF)-like protein